MKDIKDLNLEELKVVFKDWGAPGFHAQQVFSWIYKKGICDFDAMTNLSSDLRHKLKEGFYIYGLELAGRLKSQDATEKFLFKLRDANLIESVCIPSEKRVTGCLSTQAGCKYSCKFCASGMAGFKRNLSCGEIMEEALLLKNSPCFGKLSHLVFMGAGEPLDNYDNVLKAIRIINSPYAFGIGARHITISTCGIIPGIKRLEEEDLQIELSVSLHSADDKIRSELLPVNKKYPLEGVIAACRDYAKKTNRQVTFEYILIGKVNSDLKSALKLGKLLSGDKLFKVNLIPANAISELKINPPNKEEILAFKNFLLHNGINVTLRKPRGQDIDAACGQLRLKHEGLSKKPGFDN